MKPLLVFALLTLAMQRGSLPSFGMEPMNLVYTKEKPLRLEVSLEGKAEDSNVAVLLNKRVVVAFKGKGNFNTNFSLPLSYLAETNEIQVTSHNFVIHDLELTGWEADAKKEKTFKIRPTETFHISGMPVFSFLNLKDLPDLRKDPKIRDDLIHLNLLMIGLLKEKKGDEFIKKLEMKLKMEASDRFASFESSVAETKKSLDLTFASPSAQIIDFKPEDQKKSVITYEADGKIAELKDAYDTSPVVVYEPKVNMSDYFALKVYRDKKTGQLVVIK